MEVRSYFSPAITLPASELSFSAENRALVLFEMDNDLTFAIDVILNILPVFLFMQQMWPCAGEFRSL